MARVAHNHQVCVDTALERAELVCAKQNLRFTPLRKTVLELGWKGHEPVGAYELLDELAKQGRSASPPTVDRALEFLLQAGLVHKLDSLNAFGGCADPESGTHSAFLICRSCKVVDELSAETIERDIAALSASHDFFPERHTVEVEGLCSACREAEQQSAAKS